MTKSTSLPTAKDVDADSHVDDFHVQIAGEVVVFASNEENQRKSTREDSVKMDEVSLRKH
jgi:hypothetical protein